MGYSKQDFLDSEIAVRCNTRDEHDSLMAELDKIGITWSCGHKLSEHERFRNPDIYRVGANNHLLGSDGGRPIVNYNDLFLDNYAGYKNGDYVVAVKDTMGFDRGDLLRIDEYVHDPAPFCIRVSDGKRWPVAVSKIRPAKLHEILQPSDWDRFLNGKIALTVKKTEWEAFALALEDAGITKWRDGDSVRKRFGNGKECTYGVRIRGNLDGLSYWGDDSCTLPTRAFASIYGGNHDQKIIITTDGRVTTAKLIEGKRTVREAKATCNPKDEFNFMEGAQRALDRLANGDKSWLADEQVIEDAVRAIKDHADKIMREVLND